MGVQDMTAELTSGQQLMAESRHMGVEVKIAADKLDRLEAENEQYRELIRILDHDWNIEASWDGLRKFWHIGLTEKGVAERDAENAKMRKLMRDTYDCICEMYRYMDGRYAYEDAEADPAYGPILKRMRDFEI